MKYFLQMTEYLKKPPDRAFNRENYDAAYWQQTFKEAQILVFNHVLDEVASTPEDLYELDLPFRVCSFESLGEGFKLLSVGDENNPNQMWLQAILVREDHPRQYSAIVLMKMRQLETFGFRQEAKTVDRWVIRTMRMLNEKDHKHVFVILKHLLKTLSRSEVGTENVRQRFKIGSGSSKEHYTIRKIIRVIPKKDRNSAVALFSREIDWSHRFRVRGHWRVISGLGKDREGRYCIKDFTWVTDFIKGPEDKPLVEKVRMVNAPT